MKTAGTSASRIFGFSSKTGDEFISRHSRSAKFAYDYSTCVIGNLRRFDRICTADERKREERYSSVACTGHIENLTSLSAAVMGRFVRLKKHHPVFAQRDQNILSLPFLKKRFAVALKIHVFGWRCIVVTPGNSRGKERFSAVWFDYCNAAPV